MKLGEKICFIREFRKMTQKELGLALGFTENPQVRIAQYESGFRTPKREMLEKLAKVLDVHIYALDPDLNGMFYIMMELLLWQETKDPFLFSIITAQPREGTKPSSEKHFAIERKITLEYTDPTRLYELPPTFLHFPSAFMGEALREWGLRQDELLRHKITYEEYIEWKLNWPDSCDECGTVTPKKEWRKTPSTETT